MSRRLLEVFRRSKCGVLACLGAEVGNATELRDIHRGDRTTVSVDGRSVSRTKQRQERKAHVDGAKDREHGVHEELLQDFGGQRLHIPMSSTPAAGIRVDGAEDRKPKTP